MNILTVAEDVEGLAGFTNLPISEIAYLEYIKKINRVVVHTPDRKYYLMGTLQFWQNCLSANGYKFVTVDRTNVVNLDKISYMDKQHHVAYFDAWVDDDSKKCTLTSARYDIIARLLSMETRSVIFV